MARLSSWYMKGYVILDHFITLDLAEIAAEGLRREGIDAKTNPNHRTSTHGYAFPAGGVPVYVKESELSEAKRIVNLKFKNQDSKDGKSEED